LEEIAMRAMVYTRPGTVELLDVDEPSARVGEIVIEVAACGICGSELHGAITDLSPDRLAFAERLGADSTTLSLEGEFDLVFDAVGASVTRRDALGHVRPAGTVVCIGLLDSDPGFDALDLVRMEKHVIGSFAYSKSDFRDAVALADHVDLGFSTQVDLDSGAAIFRELMNGRTDIVKVLLRPRVRSS
jgi:threonine dehydrogenase-like Zn-dependent dehydrogenase